MAATINVRSDFAERPFGRYPKHGPYNGEVFRDKHLIPALRESERVVVILDGVKVYGSSFLEEAFGGLVRREGLTPQQFAARVEIVSHDNPTLPTEIKQYVAESYERYVRH